MQPIPFQEQQHLTDTRSIILVHGIGGHWKKSWEYEGFSWIEHFLHPDLEKAGLTADIWSYGYDSRTTANSVANIDDVAIALLDWIYNYEASGPIIFVAHSLGGLVVKKASNPSQFARISHVSAKNERF
jgi:alpha-beta hydrolase superfamily lysophospholipase